MASAPASFRPLVHFAAAWIAGARYWTLQFTGDADCQGKSGAW